MKMKKGMSWKAGFNERTGKYGAEIVFRGSWDLYEITADVYGRLSDKMDGGEAERLISGGRRLYFHVNDGSGPPYNVILDDDYADYCPWMKKTEPDGNTWSPELTDAAVELFESEKANRGQRRKKRAQRNKKEK